MEFGTHTKFSAIIAAIEEQSKAAEIFGLAATASLLEMAKLQAQIELNNITNSELAELCDKAAEKVAAGSRQTGGLRHSNARLGHRTALLRARTSGRVGGGRPA